MSSLKCLIRGCTGEQKYGSVCEKHKNANICVGCTKPFVKVLVGGRCGNCFRNYIASGEEAKIVPEIKTESKEVKTDSRKLNTCIECKKSFVKKLINERCGWCNKREKKRVEEKARSEAKISSDKKESKEDSKEETTRKDSKEKKVSKEEAARKEKTSVDKKGESKEDSKEDSKEKKVPEECPICLENYTSSETLTCENTHHLHKQCIIKSGKMKCPLCRGKVKGLTRIEAKELKDWNKKYNKQDEKKERHELREEVNQEAELYLLTFMHELFPQYSDAEFEELTEENPRIVMRLMRMISE